MRLPLGLAFFVLFSLVLSAQPPVTTGWKKNIKLSLNSINKATAIKMDKSGNCYVLGTTWMPDSTKDLLLVKLNPEGKEEWIRTYDGPAHGDEISAALSIDSFDNIWITGMSKPSADNADFLIVKFNPEGVAEADKIIDGGVMQFDAGTCITNDASGNAYAAGYVTTADSGLNLMLVSVNPLGALRWTRTYVTIQMDIANSIFTDDSSNVYVTGNVNVGTHSSDIIVMKFDSVGKKMWQKTYDGPLAENDAANIAAQDDSSNIYITGYLNHLNSRADIPLLKFNRDGGLLQENLFNGRIADCGANSLNFSHKSIYVSGICIDYMANETSSYVIRFNKAGKREYELRNPADVNFLSYMNVGNRELALGTLLTHPESTLIPYIAEPDTVPNVKWVFADSTVYGLSHMISITKRNDQLYFLGDDTGEATGTITVLNYTIHPEVIINESDRKKRPGTTKRK